ncbi:alpha/beta hydrolase family protein [Lysobacter silvisoli]|uniref:Alpha/beta hydrolase n=1 Tax=Lysobacter silvisoli TaxID=2293254 RepID=A0A371JY04_9GAMM|nr:alpha/beta hydrolase [Lysobacter silvisoli]RDZ26520.1 alpha/beta hydrolase [Lysobacter silvisoli]
MPHARLPLVLALTAALISPMALASNATDSNSCYAGAYKLDDGRMVDLANADKGALRWRLIDGRTGRLSERDGAWTSTLGWTDRPDNVKVSFGSCQQDKISFEGVNGRKLQFDITETRFEGNGVNLRGRLVMPRGAGPVPVIVTVHGSESYSGVDRYHMQNLYPANGVGVFVYDKRGTGESGGKYTQDFYLLSDDASAALREAKRLAGKRASRIGYLGGSQAGWVAPLAASKTPEAAFVVVGYGMAISPLGEDASQVALDLKNAGYGEDVQAKAREVTDATGTIVASRGKDGWDALTAVRQKYGEEPWWKAMKGEFTGLVVSHTPDQLRAKQAELEQGTTWDYDPMPVLRELKQPQLWMLAGADAEAPPEETRDRLMSVVAAGRPLSVAVFPETDHGILKFETAADGSRTPIRIADGYFRMQLDWIKTGKLGRGPYGDAQVLAGGPPTAPPVAKSAKP